MYFEKKGMIIALILIFSVPHASSFQLLFSSPGIQYINISIPYSNVTSFNFTVTGSNYSNSYPTNISIDVGNDGIQDWEYKVYNSNLTVPVSSVLNAWSNDIGLSSFNIINVTQDYILSMFMFGSLNENNIFMDNGNNNINNGTLGIDVTTLDLNSQILTIVTNDSTIHAFIPNLDIPMTSSDFGLYIAKGGSTYYCASTTYLGQGQSQCDLSPNSMNSTYLARMADAPQFNYTELVNNPHSVSTINNILKSCSLPCNITIKVSSDTAGEIDLDNFNFQGSSSSVSPSNITVTENNTDYSVNIENFTTLINVSYFYGIMPTVYVIPFIAQNDIRSLNINQTNRLQSIKDNLANAWDDLTNSSHPLNFVFYNITRIANLSISDNYNSFQDRIMKTLIPTSNFSNPAILLMVDVMDYYPNQYPICYPNFALQKGIISLAYVNGVNNATVSTLDNFNNETLINILLHEISHTFLGYPQSQINGDYLFYTAHPAIFRDDNVFPEHYGLSFSPTGEEGYYEIYSIMNPARIYLESSQLSSRNAELSTLDKILLGIQSPDLGGDYTFYSGSISLVGNKFIATSMTPLFSKDLKAILPYTSDSIFWDVRNTPSVTMGTKTTFSISKSNQKNASLWVYARDPFNPNYFEVFNSNSQSTSKLVNDKTPPNISFVNPTTPNGTLTNKKSLTINVSAFDNFGIFNISINLYNSTSGLINSSISYGINDYNNFSLPKDGIYYFNATAYDYSNNNNFTETRLITLDTTPPGQISNLTYSLISQTFIYLNWSVPSQDYYKSIVFVNGVNVINTTNNYYIMDDLSAGTTYDIEILTEDSLLNINSFPVSTSITTNPFSSTDTGGGSGGGSGGSSSSSTTTPSTLNNTINTNNVTPPLNSTNYNNALNQENKITGNSVSDLNPSTSSGTKSSTQSQKISNGELILLAAGAIVVVFLLLINVVRRVRRADSVSRLILAHLIHLNKAENP